MIDERPNPDDLLARVQSEEKRANRGKLKVFFGYAAGVGKTYAMLEAAHHEKKSGIDVVVGYVEPHGRPETEALLAGLEAIPFRAIPYRGITLKEFDLDAALKRHPRIILVDELAHTNAEGSRHARRWQDIDELLEAGIDVYSTLNVQHVESLNDVIAQITGVVVHETVPDAVIERADDIELIDLTPEELIERLKEGKIYVSHQAQRALEHFFQRTNLVALREISLRQAAQRIGKDVEAARREKSATTPWATSERLLVCVGPSPTSAKLIRTAKRMAVAMNAELLAVAIDLQGTSSKSMLARQQISQHLQLADQLGAETHTLSGTDPARVILEFARKRNITKIIVGKTRLPRWKRLLFGSFVDALLEDSGDIDVYAIRGAMEGTRTPTPQHGPTTPRAQGDYWRTAAIVGICTLLGWLSHAMRLTEANIVMVFLLGVAFVAARYGRGPAIAASIVSVLLFDFFFVPPYLTFAVSDVQYLITFAVMLIIGIIISALTARMQAQLVGAQQLERRADALFRLTKQLSEAAGLEFLLQMAGRQLREIFDGEAVLLLRGVHRTLEYRFGKETAIAHHEVNLAVAQWVADHDQLAGPGTDTLPNATALFAPLLGSRGTLGAIGVQPRQAERFLDPEQRRLLETCASLIALSLERDQSVLDAHETQLKMRTEQLRNSLLSSVSHDLRTPLAAMAGSASTLLEGQIDNPEARQQLLRSIVEESQRLARLVDNLLEMTRLESGSVTVNKQWHVLEEIIGSALAHVRVEKDQHPVRVDIPADFPLLYVDGVSLEQVFVNLLENAVRYTPAGTLVEINARMSDQRALIRFSDRGPGIPPGSEERIFEKFERGAGPAADGRRGIGLGLAICQGIVQAHGGRITASNRPTGGAEFLIVLPQEKPVPPVMLDELPARRNS